jgi:hypothetical protein
MSMENTSLPRIEIGCYRLHFQPASAIPEGRYTGSAWRAFSATRCADWPAPCGT